MDVQRTLTVGDICRAEAHIAAVINNDNGKVVKVKGHVLRDDKAIIEIVSSFLYRGVYFDFENTFESIDEPDYLVEMQNDTDVGVLQSKEWFNWEDESVSLAAGTSLVFRLKSEVTYKDKTHYSKVLVTGDVFSQDQLKKLFKVGTVQFESDESHGNPVVAYLQRHGSPQDVVSTLSSEGYSLTADGQIPSFTAPLTNELYSKVSGDFNPIHINPYFSDLASLPGTITHGLWSSAATRRYVETVAAQGQQERVVS